MRSAGFSISELMITLAISALIVSMVIPSYRPLIEKSRLTTSMNALTAALALARSQAISKNQRVVFCASSDGRQCDTHRYEDGWIIFIDYNRDNRRQASEETLLWVEQALHSELSLRATAAYRSRIAFSPTGRLTRGFAGNITLCSKGDYSRARKLILIASGRMRIVASQIKSCNL